MSAALDSLSSLPDKVSFTKFSASANDFIVIDNRSGLLTSRVSQLAQRLCARRYSVGADGLILIENSGIASVRVHFYNPDGNEFNTCGNGGRCAARFAFLSNLADSKMTIETNVGVIDAVVTAHSVKLKFVRPAKIRLNMSVTVEEEEFHGHVVNLGEPHFVVFDMPRKDLPFAPTAGKIRHHAAFGEEGANVHFIEIVSRQKIRIRSFERGVEDETFACGSGCVSAAVSTFSANQAEPPMIFEPHSGIPLTVHFSPDNKFEDLYLEGDARLIYEGEFTKEAVFGFPEFME